MYVVQYWCTALYFIEHLHRFYLSAAAWINGFIIIIISKKTAQKLKYLIGETLKLQIYAHHLGVTVIELSAMNF